MGDTFCRTCSRLNAVERFSLGECRSLLDIMDSSRRILTSIPGASRVFASVFRVIGNRLRRIVYAMAFTVVLSN